MHRKIRIILAARSPIPFPHALALLPKCHLNALLAAVLMLASSANAEVAPAGDAANLDAVQVTANRFAEQVQEVPNSIEVIGAEELRARGVNDLRTALSLLGGVSVAPGGDGGPAAARASPPRFRGVGDF